MVKSITFSVNLEIYPLEIIYSTAYLFLDKVYFYMDKEQEDKIKIELTKKNGSDNLEEIKNEFMNEMMNQAFRLENDEKTKDFKEILIKRVLDFNENTDQDNIDEEMLEKILDDEDDDWLDDPEGIAIPWEEKYGKNDEDKSE